MYVGLDVHKDFCQAAFVSSKGKVVKEKSFKNNTEGLEELAKATRKHNVVIESSSSSMRVYDALSKTCKVKVAHPAKVKAIASARIKTDKIDARILAQLLRADLIPESFVPCEAQSLACLGKNKDQEPDTISSYKRRRRNTIRQAFRQERVVILENNRDWRNPEDFSGYNVVHA